MLAGSQAGSPGTPGPPAGCKRLAAFTREDGIHRTSAATYRVQDVVLVRFPLKSSKHKQDLFLRMPAYPHGR